MTTFPQQVAPRLEKPLRITEHDWPEGTIPVVSIICPTYNHEKFIEQCLESFFMQETTFPVEIIIHDDASTDRTTQIVRACHAKYPRLIRTIVQKENRFQNGKDLSFLYKTARGEYIALCEGDDYWTEPHKLQKQVDFLDKHPDYSICGHRFMHVCGDHPAASPFPSPVQRESGTLEDILRWNYLLTCTIVYRAGLVTEIPSRFKNLLHGDMPMWVLLAQRGRVGYINEIMAAYRLHSGGVWTGTSIETKIAELEKTIDAIHNHLENRYPRLHRASLCIRYAECATHYTRTGDYANARRRLRKAFLKSPATFCTLADARTCIMEQFRFCILHPLVRSCGWCVGMYHRARIWAGANRRRLWKAITRHQHGENPKR